MIKYLLYNTIQYFENDLLKNEEGNLLKEKLDWKEGFFRIFCTGQLPLKQIELEVIQYEHEHKIREHKNSSKYSVCWEGAHVSCGQLKHVCRKSVAAAGNLRATHICILGNKYICIDMLVGNKDMCLANFWQPSAIQRKHATSMATESRIELWKQDDTWSYPILSVLFIWICFVDF